MNRFIRFGVFSALALAASAAPSLHASLLVYEGFTGYTGNGARLDQYKPNANTIGLDTSKTYYDGSETRTANYTLSAGLTFGPLQTAGNALAFTSGTNVIGADIDIASPHTGTLWSSYLVRLTAQGGANGNGAVIRVGATPADSTNGYFNSWADSRANADTKNVSIAYGPAGPNPPNNGDAPLSLNTTYIIISRFTNVGATLSGGTSGVATLWALDAGQFAAFLEAGGNETALDGTSVTATASQTVSSGTYVFSSSKAVGFVTVGDAGVFDELRFGSTLGSVIPVPEPATAAALAGLAACAFCGFARRRLS